MVGMRGLGRRIFDFYWGQGIADDVPALTYYLLLSLAPFALGIAALEASLLEDLVGARDVADQLNRFLPDAVHQDIERLVVSTRDSSRWLLALAVAAMLWTTSGAIGVIERCRVADARHRPPQRRSPGGSATWRSARSSRWRSCSPRQARR